MRVPVRFALFALDIFLLLGSGCSVLQTPIPTPAATPMPILTPTVSVPMWHTFSAGRGECSVQSFFSAALGEPLSFSLYLPPGYLAETQRRYPAVYLLSGGGGNYQEWVQYGVCPQMDQLILSGRVQPMIVVMPSGNDNPAVGEGSYWFNHAPPPASDGKRWGDYIWKDVVTYIDSKYRTLPRRESRAIGGLSAGGQGALTHALTHPEIFSVIGAHSPSFRHADGSMPEFGDAVYYNQYDPIWLVQNTRSWLQLKIWVDDGDSDTQWGSAIRDFHDLLIALNIPHDWQLYPGAHTPTYWQANVPVYLQWYSTELTGQ